MPNKLHAWLVRRSGPTRTGSKTDRGESCD